MIRAMAGNDSAFLWETEALRSAGAPQKRPEPTPQPPPPAGDWRTLREASEATGIPVPTLRKWARRESVPSYLETTPVGEKRMVSMAGVLARAHELGREIELEEMPIQQPPPPPRDETQHATPVAFAPPAANPEPEVPAGTMLVPIDAWDKMLLQLGNLHEAGQQLADARERAAKAETESKFLKERLSELRAQLAEAKTAPSPAPPEPRPTPPPVEPITHIPIEGDVADSKELGDSPDSGDAQESGDSQEPGESQAPGDARESGKEKEEDTEIVVREVGRLEPDRNPPFPRPDEDGMTLTGYSIKMLDHIYSTWRRRPRR